MSITKAIIKQPLSLIITHRGKSEPGKCTYYIPTNRQSHFRISVAHGIQCYHGKQGLKKICDQKIEAVLFGIHIISHCMIIYVPILPYFCFIWWNIYIFTKIKLVWEENFHYQLKLGQILSKHTCLSSSKLKANIFLSFFKYLWAHAYLLAILHSLNALNDCKSTISQC